VTSGERSLLKKKRKAYVRLEPAKIEKGNKRRKREAATSGAGGSIAQDQSAIKRKLQSVEGNFRERGGGDRCQPVRGIVSSTQHATGPKKRVLKFKRSEKR